MPLTRRPLTSKALAARRRNARKSTGPRTERGKRRSALNAFKGGVIRTLPLRTMLALGEKPQDYQRLLEGLLEAYQPANPAERMLVEDIALLHLRKQRNQQAQDGLILKNLGKLVRERAQRQQEITYELSNFSDQRAEEIGLVNIEDSPAKFKEVVRLLDLVQREVDQGQFTPEGRELLARMFGPDPSMRAARIVGSYSHLLSCGAAFRASPDADENVNGSSSAPAKGGANLPAALPAAAEDVEEQADAADEEQILNESIYEDLRSALLEERLLTGERYQHYLEARMESLPAVRAAALAPSDFEWRMLIRQEEMIDKQVERKTRLLLFTQWVRRSGEGGRKPYIYEKRKLVSDEE